MAVNSGYDRRLSERHKLNLKIDLVLSNGTILPIETCNISSNGLQFRCDGWVADEIEPRGIHNHTLEQINVKVVGQLPVDTTSKFYARARIISARRLSQDEYLVGLGFLSFEGDGGKALSKLISQYEKRTVVRKQAITST